MEIPFPPLEVQREIVAEIEIYQKVIHDAQERILHTGKKIQAAISLAWGKDKMEKD